MKPNRIASTAFACALTALFSTSAFAGDITQSSSADGKATVTSGTASTPTPLDLLSVDEDYTGASNVRQGPSYGKQTASHTALDYSHRFHVTGQWYLRLGVAYERFDFSHTSAPLPDHLQQATATIAYEYVVQGFPAAAIELHPGFYYQNDAEGRDFAVPVDIYSAFPIEKDKVFGMVGAYTSPFIKPQVIPIGGVIWLVNDKVRLEALFPRPALIYTLNDDWECRFAGEISGGGFRMDRTGRDAVLAHQGSVVQYEYYQAGPEVKYTHWKGTDLTVGAGYSFEREFDFFRDGPYQKYKAVGAPYIKIAIETKF